MFERLVFPDEEYYDAVNQQWEKEDYEQLKEFSVFYSSNPSIPMKLIESERKIVFGEEDDGRIRFLKNDMYYLPVSFLDSTIKQLQEIKNFLEKKGK